MRRCHSPSDILLSDWCFSYRTWSDWLIVIEIFNYNFVTAITLFTIKTFYWYQLQHNLGPLAISVKKSLYDLLMIMLVWGVFFAAFAAGIGLIMNEEEIKSRNSTSEGEEEEFNAFHYWLADNSTDHSMDGVFKTMFWSLFDPGKPEYLGPSHT